MREGGRLAVCVLVSVATARVSFTRSGVFLFYLGFLQKICFFYSGQIFVHVCCITALSIKEYSSFTGVILICAESVASADVSSSARLNQIFLNIMVYRLSTN